MSSIFVEILRICFWRKREDFDRFGQLKVYLVSGGREQSGPLVSVSFDIACQMGGADMTSLATGGVAEFRFYRPQANIAFVVGDFNHWSKTASPMQRATDGWWVARIPLPAGEYRFRYLADGHWFADFASYGVERSHDGWTSVLVVPKRGPVRPAVALKGQFSTEAAHEIQRDRILSRATG